jgi:carbonic anhydrase/acetyltransferase-like protein (isoleucine patch superfamily)
VIPARQATLSDNSFQIFQPLGEVPSPLTLPPDKGGANAPASDSPEAGARFLAPRVASPELIEGATLVGGVVLAENVTVGRGSYLHGGDAPAISIGANTQIGRNTSIHELTFTSVRIGSRVVVGDRVVLHGPLVIGNNVSIGDGTVLFGPTVADNVKIGARVLAFGPMEISHDVPDDSILVPPGMEALIAPSHKGPRTVSQRSPAMDEQWTVATEAGSCGCCSGILLHSVSRGGTA